ncbi:2-hydroxychromene-2-carboxylate isomerase [Ahniella affigens]|nr:2-hydroxychromene-2-carboxylate isomerase [Ahniella affigens]
MPPAVLYFDVVSPFAYLLDALLRREPLPVAITYRPVLFAGLLNAHGHKGPAEIPRKRQFMYQYCVWWAEQLGVPFKLPAAHPFNPLKFLRLIIALDSRPDVVSTVFDALFTTGADPTDPALWQQICIDLNCPDAEQRIEAPEVKSALRENTECALRDGVFGVPTILVDGRLFWGADALPMLRDYLRTPSLLDSPAMMQAMRLPISKSRL